MLPGGLQAELDHAAKSCGAARFRPDRSYLQRQRVELVRCRLFDSQIRTLLGHLILFGGAFAPTFPIAFARLRGRSRLSTALAPVPKKIIYERF